MNPTLRCVPLGGLGEIGRNMMVLECGEDIVVVDVGVMFPENEMLGVDLVIPDVSYLLDKLDRIRGVVITHGHEDHTGALPYVLPQLNFPPLWGTPLTLGLVRGKLKEHRLAERVTLNTITPGEPVRLGGLTAEFFRVSHSIPDGVGLALRTPAGLVVHSGDFKFDHTPADGRPTDFAALARFGSEGVFCLFSDSTNADTAGYTRSEQLVGAALERIIARARGRVIITTFASLIARLQQIVDAAVTHGRRVGVVGRSMVQNVAIAQELGYLRVPPGAQLRPEEVNRINALPPEKVVIVTTGSQGEPTSALTRMANRDHRQIEIVAGDTVVMSSAPIPGNEELISRTIDNLFRLGANVIWGRESDVHVSGHGSQEDQKMMLALVKPKYFVPVHGEYRHLVLHARLAEASGVAPENIMVVEDGDVLELGADHAAVTGRVSAGYVYVDGLGVGDVGEVVLRDRRHLSEDGILIVTVTVDRLSGRPVAGPDIDSRGFVGARVGAELFDGARAKVTAAIAEANVHMEGETHRVDWQFVKNKIRVTLAAYVYARTRRRPVVLPLVMEV